MTDPMTSVEIEDVLSSIRRLVSEDLRPGMATAARAAPQAAAVPAVAPEAGKLLLTPALRVVPNEAPLPLPVSEIIPEAPFMEVPALDEDSRGAVVARIGAQVSDDWDAELETVPGGWPAPTWEAEVVEVDLEAVEEAEVLEVTSVEDARLEEAWRDGAWPDERLMQAENDPVTLFQPSLEGEGGAASEVTPDALADLAEAAVLAEIEAADSAAAMAATADLFAPQDSEDFDEEALREVVRDIIREELQGALGERITRNVRKLVRAEINRALASRELS